jgi:pimeloyl-ACP methyl ester carboxylesterase
MPLMPFHVLGIWLRGLFALALLGAGASLLREWYEHRRVVVEEPVATRAGEVRPPDDPRARDRARRDLGVERRTVEWHFGLNRETASLLGGLALTALSLGGGALGYPLIRRRGADDPRVAEGTDSARGGEETYLRRPDGTELRVTCLGPEDAPVLVMTHGWGVNSAEWHYAKDHLASRYRLILWDLPGLGKSQRPDTSDWSLEKMARDLDAVAGLAGARSVVLLGHSIGGMITLTYCRLFPETLGRRVAGLALVHTTSTNPVKTTGLSALFVPLQKPVLEPLCHLMIALAPLVWVMNWMSYLNGTQHRSTERSGFSGRETAQQLDFAARFLPKAWPGVLARGMLAMFRYDATDVLDRINVPTLVVAGDRDRTTNTEASIRMAETIPSASLVILEPAKHMGHMEHHARFAEAVDRFVASCAAEPKPVGPSGGL